MKSVVLPDAARLARLALPSWAILVVLWALAVAGHDASPILGRAVLVVAATLTVGYAWRRRSELTSRENRPLLVLLAVGFMVGFAGLGHEVGKGYYTDEGHYLHHAREVNAGKPFTPSFVYPHLLYYLDAFVLYLAQLFAAPAAWLGRVLYGVEDPQVLEWLLLRLTTAGLGVLTVVPVFVLARQVFSGGARGENKGAGSLAGIVAGGLMVFSIHYHEGFQVNICDVPSAAFAAFCLMFVGRLVDAENRRDYVIAGVASGLAAAAKYPAGVVAVAIAGVWTIHRLRRRDWNFGLLWAGLGSLATFLVLHPSLFVLTEAALHGPRGFFFGARQYASGGWVGVMPGSNTIYYLGHLLGNFRWPAVILAALGAVGLPAAVRRRLLFLLPFPVAFFALICSMNMVVLRNLFPVIPALAVVLGVMAAGLGHLAAERWPRYRRAVAATVVLLALAWPAAAMVRQTGSLVRASTRDAMHAWVRAHMPRGAGILKDSYTPNFNPYEYRSIERRFAFRIPEERYRDERFDYLMVAGSAYWRWLRPENADKPHGDWYRRVFENYELVHEVQPGTWRRGPLLRLYRLPATPPVPGRRVFRAEDAFLTHPSMQTDDAVAFTRHGRLAIFRATLASGPRRVRLQGQVKGGDVTFRRLGLADATVTIALNGKTGDTMVSQPDTYFIEIRLPAGSRLRKLVLDLPVDDDGEGF